MHLHVGVKYVSFYVCIYARMHTHVFSYPSLLLSPIFQDHVMLCVYLHVDMQDLGPPLVF